MPSNTTFIIHLINISNNLNQYFGIFIFLFGCLGNILNISVLSQRTLRTNPCALLFLASSVSNLIVILSGLTSRILSGWNIDLTNTIQWLCKLRIFVVFPARTAAYWFIMLASIDRWLLSSVHTYHRQMSPIKNARRGIIIIIIFSIVLYIQAPICYEIIPNNVPLQCYGKTKICRMTIDLTYSIVTISLPLFMMNLFTLKTILNVRRTRNRVQHLPMIIKNSSMIRPQAHHNRWKKRDQRLFVMLFTQIILFTLFTFPLGIQRIYITMTMNNVKSDIENTVDNFIYNLVVLLSFLANGLPFYIYTLTGGKVFRKTLSNVMRCIY